MLLIGLSSVPSQVTNGPLVLLLLTVVYYNRVVVGDRKLVVETASSVVLLTVFLYLSISHGTYFCIYSFLVQIIQYMTCV
jgi:hypothetical protein